MRKFLCLLLAACLLLFSLCGFALSEEIVETVDEDVEIVRWLVDIAEPMLQEDTIHDVLAAVNDKLARLAQPLRLELLTYTATDGIFHYSKYVREQFASGLMEADLVNMPGDAGLFSYASQGYLEDLTPYLNQYPVVYSVAGETTWKLATIGQSIFGIPTDAIRANISDVVSLPSSEWAEGPEDAQELLNWIALRHEEDGSVLLGNAFAGTVNPAHFLHRTYAEWPFYVDMDGLFYYDSQGNLSSYIESPAYFQDSSWMSAFYDTGAVVLGNTHPMAIGTLGNDFPEALIEDFESLGHYKLNPDSPDVINYTREYHVIPRDGNADAAFRLLDWLYSSRENYLLLTSGIENVHYTINEYNLPTEIIGEYDMPLYFWGIAFTHQFSVLLPDTETQAAYLKMHNMTEEQLSGDGIILPCTGFAFDPSPVQAEHDQLLAAMQSGLYAQILRGKESLSLLDDAVDELNRAGLSAVMEECDRQYTEYKAIM